MMSAAAESQARIELWSFLKTGNGAHVLRAFRIYRKHEQPIPENVLSWLDVTFGRVLLASTPKAVAKALRVSPDRGGMANDRSAKVQRRKAEFLAEVQARIPGLRPGVTLDSIIESAAKSHGYAASTGKKLWYEYSRAIRRNIG